MRICIFLSIFLFSICELNAQRFHQRLNTIISEPYEQKIPNQFPNFRQWFNQSIDDIYFTDLQFSQNQAGGFYKMGLIFRKENKFEIGKTGVFIEFQDTINGKQRPVYINCTEQLDILNYTNNFDPINYNPNDLKKKTELALITESIDQLQFLAQTINFFGVSSKNKSALQYISEDISSRSPVRINVSDDAPAPLDSIAKQIYVQTGDYAHNLIYDLYFKDDDHNKEYRRFLDFFSFLSPNMSNKVDELASLKVFFQVEKETVKLRIPERVIQLLESDDADKPKNSALYLLPADIRFNVINQYGSEPYLEMDFVLFPGSSEDSFIIPQEIKLNPSPIFPDSGRENRVFKVSQIKNFFIRIYEKRTEMFLKTDYDQFKIDETKGF